MAISRLAISKPLGTRTFRLRLFLLTLVSLKLPEVFRLTSRPRGVVVLGSRPRSFSGHSIFMISAPSAPSQRVAHGPARTQLKSTTRTCSSARGRDMASFSRLSPLGLAANERNGDMPHRCVGLGAVPMTFARLDVRDIAHIDLTLLMLCRHHAGARCHDQDLI